MKALITGIDGFVGEYLEKELKDNGYEVYGLSVTASGHNRFLCDITNFDELNSIIKTIKPDYIFHLAGFSTLPESFKNPELCFKINVDGTKNLLKAVSDNGLNPKILIVSSSLVYGNPAYNPIDEKCPLNPASPYAHSRIEQEKAALDSGLDVVISRSFNHTGPTQKENFAIPSFKKQVRDAKDGDVILVGNLNVIKDFSDVRDVVKAYRLLLEKGVPGEIYNVGSGIEYSMRAILERIIHSSGKKLEIVVDPARVRPVEIPKSICDNRKLHAIIGFKFREIDYSI